MVKEKVCRSCMVKKNVCGSCTVKEKVYGSYMVTCFTGFACVHILTELLKTVRGPFV